MPSTDWLHSPRPLTLAHRGGAGLWPENTLFAFGNAVRLGCEVLETDAHVTRDGVVVLCHDATVDRTTNGKGAIARMTLSEVQALDAAYRFELGASGVFPLRGKGLRIPTLAEAATELPSARFNVDLKAVGTGERVWEVVQTHDLFGRIVVASESHRRLQAFRSLSAGQVPTSASALEALSFGVAASVGLASRLNMQCDAFQVPVRWGLIRFLSPSFLKAAQERRLPVHFWTPNTRLEMESALSLGASGLVTDFPDLALTLTEGATRGVG